SQVALGAAEGDETTPNAPPTGQSGGAHWNVGHGLRPGPTCAGYSDTGVEPGAMRQRRINRHGWQPGRSHSTAPRATGRGHAARRLRVQWLALECSPALLAASKLI